MAITNLNVRVDYLIVQCGYVERLIPQMERIKEVAFAVKPLCLYGSGEVIEEWTGEYDYGILKHAEKHKSSVVVKVNGNINTALQFVSDLMDYDHCAMFRWFCLFKFEIIETPQGNICRMLFDTESG